MQPVGPKAASDCLRHELTLASEAYPGWLLDRHLATVASADDARSLNLARGDHNVGWRLRLDDYIAEDNTVRVVEAFVEELDLRGLGFDGVEPCDTGRPSYHPSVLPKIYIYGYLNHIQSSRRLERECQRNLELMWLTGRLDDEYKCPAGRRCAYRHAHPSVELAPCPLRGRHATLGWKRARQSGAGGSHGSTRVRV